MKRWNADELSELKSAAPLRARFLPGIVKERDMALGRARRLPRASGLLPLLALAWGACQAQAPVPAGEQVAGPQLQAWLDQKFSYAGTHHASGCVVLNVAAGSGRALMIRCPNGWAEKLPGTARVVGDTYCTSFPIPNTPPGEDCVTWHSIGQWKFEQRKAGALDTSVILLPAGLTPAK
jgi:hypothetical protein